MKSNKLGFLISTVMMLLVLLMICFLSVRFVKKGTASMLFADQGELRNTIEISLSEAKDFSIAYTSDNIKVYPIEGNTVIIKEYLSSRRNEDALATVNVGSGKATVIGGKRMQLSSFMWISIDERIEIYLPKEGIENLELRTSSGNITAEDEFVLMAKNVSVTAKSGNIKWQDTEALQVDLEASSGNLRVNRITADAILLTAKSGNITAEEMDGQAEVSAGSGNVTLENFSGNGSVSTQSGNVKVEAKEIEGDMSLEVGSGNLRLEIPNELSFEAEINTGSGTIRTDFEHSIICNKSGNHAAGVVGEMPVGKLSLKAGSGNVSLKIADQ